jgi:hypothetical protein
MSEPKYLYRYREQRYAPSCDENGDCYGKGNMRLHLEKFLILKETKCGVWISKGVYFIPDKEREIPKELQKFVNLTCRKKYACSTIEEAKESFISRKKAHIRILNSQLEDAELALRMIENNY